MADDRSDLELRAHVIELGRITSLFENWEQRRRDDHQEYRDTYQEVRAEFRRLHTELGGIADAVTKTATDVELIAQQVRISSKDISKIEETIEAHAKRLTSLESSRTLERGAWAVVVLAWGCASVIAGVAITTIIPNFIPSWLKGGQ